MPHVIEINLTVSKIWRRTASCGRACWRKRRGLRCFCFFQSLDWLETYWRHFAGEQRLRVLVVLDDGRPLGILPLVVVPETTKMGTVRVLTYPMAGWGSYYGPIGPQPAATLAAGLAHIGATPRDWCLLDLRWINREKIDRRRTERAMQFVGLPAREAVWSQTALVEFEHNCPNLFRPGADRGVGELLAVAAAQVSREPAPR